MKKILIVEDDQSLRELLKINLENKGFECLTAEDGQIAVKIVQEQNLDLVILDLMIPKLSGEHVCKEIKISKDTKHIPVIMLTAKDSDVDRIIGKVVGADIYLNKPCDISVLLENISKLIGLQG